MYLLMILNIKVRLISNSFYFQKDEIFVKPKKISCFGFALILWAAKFCNLCYLDWKKKYSRLIAIDLNLKSSVWTKLVTEST